MDIPRDVSQMSQDELTFYYFKMIDLDGSTQIDGNELLSSIIHSTGIT